MILNISDGTTTVVLSGTSPVLGCTYFPATSDSGKDVTESVEVNLRGTEAAIRAAVNDIEQLLTDAKLRTDNLTPRVFANYNPVNTGTTCRSEIYDGRVVWSTDPGRRRLGDTNPTVRINIIWTRRGWWEGAETELYLSSSTQTERVGGVTVYNNDNVGNSNIVGIASNRVVGTRPAAVRFRITNASGGTLAWRNFYIGNNVYSAPASADVWLLGSEATAPGAAQTWAGGIDHTSRLWTIALSSTLLGQTQGRRFRVLAAFTSLSNAGYMRASVGTWIGSVYGAQQIGGERLTSATGKLVDLGLFNFPPGGYNVANSSAALVISARSSLAGSGTLDFVQLMATDSFRQLTQIGYDAANGDSIEDDGIEGGAYLLNGSNKLPIISAAGEPLKVYPEKTQRMYVLFEENGTFTAARQMTVQAWYRPIYDSI
jgi:hypothetical protein